MQSFAWEVLLSHFPPQVYQRLMLVTRGGTEFAVQSILRIDHEFMAIKGRVAGSQDAGRLFFVPFDQVDYFGFQDVVKETEFHELFDSLVMPEPDSLVSPPPQENKVSTGAAVAAAVTAAVAAATGESMASPSSAADAGPPVLPSNGSRTTNPVIKSAVLERFRARSQGKPSSGIVPRVEDEPKP